MQNIKQQLQNTGLSVVLKVTETGQTLNLEFLPRQVRKPVTLSLGPVHTEGFLELVEIPAKGTELPNLALVLVTKLRPQAAIILEPAEVKLPETKTEEPAETKTEEPAETKTEEPAETKTEEPAETKTEEPAETKTEEPPAETPPETKAEELPPPAAGIPVETEQTSEEPVEHDE